MNIPWKNDRCIACLRNGALTKEHIIPECIGGRLWSQFLCQRCNSFIGHALEAEVRSDPSIRLAVHNLQARIPRLAQKLAEHQNYIARGPGGETRGKLHNGEYRITSHLATGGSLIQPTRKARKSLRAILTKSGAEPAFIKIALEKFDGAPENEHVQVGEGLEATKWTIEAMEPDVSGAPLMNTLVPFKIAFEFLACHLGEAIYDEVPQLDELRGLLLGGEAVEKSSLRVDRLSANDYEPFHGICFEGNDPHARFQVRLFGWLAFRVHFPRLAINCDKYAYTHNLAAGTEHLSKLDPPAAHE